MRIDNARERDKECQFARHPNDGRHSETTLRSLVHHFYYNAGFSFSYFIFTFLWTVRKSANLWVIRPLYILARPPSGTMPCRARRVLLVAAVFVRTYQMAYARVCVLLLSRIAFIEPFLSLLSLSLSLFRSLARTASTLVLFPNAPSTLIFLPCSCATFASMGSAHVCAFAFYPNFSVI